MGTQAATNIHKQALAGKASASLGHLQVQTILRRCRINRGCTSWQKPWGWVKSPNSEGEFPLVRCIRCIPCNEWKQAQSLTALRFRDQTWSNYASAVHTSKFQQRESHLCCEMLWDVQSWAKMAAVKVTKVTQCCPAIWATHHGQPSRQQSCAVKCSKFPGRIPPFFAKALKREV